MLLKKLRLLSVHTFSGCNLVRIIVFDFLLLSADTDKDKAHVNDKDKPLHDKDKPQHAEVAERH